MFSLQEHFYTPKLSHSLCSILENKWKVPRRLFSLGFCYAEHFAVAGLSTSLLLGMLQVPITQLGYSLVLDRMPHALGKLLCGCVLMFTAEFWGGVWEHLGSTSSCLGMSELNSQKQTRTDLTLL